jgi:CDP-diacylglycerol--glycerol-3-phosphate 3-phosphatidyltransferase
MWDPHIEVIMPNLQDTHESGYKSFGKFWTVANMLSMARLVLIIPITYLILSNGSIKWILGLIFVAVCTDWFDGTVARWSKTVSEWGKVLDPLADKIAAASVVLALVIRGSLPVWFLSVILIRDIVIVIGSAIAAHRFRRVLMSIWWGKVAVFMLSLTILGAILKADPPVQQISLLITTVLLVYSFMLYMLRFIRIIWSNDNAGGASRSEDPPREITYPVNSIGQKAESLG